MAISSDNTLDLHDLEGIELFSARFERLNDFYSLIHIDTAPAADRPVYPASSLSTPSRLNGMLFILVHKGSARIRANNEHYALADNDILMLRPGTLMQLAHVSRTAAFTILFISSTFLNDIKIDFHGIELRPLLAKPRSAMKLDKAECRTMRRYIELLEINVGDTTTPVFAKLVAQSIIASVVYEILRFVHNRAPESDTASNSHQNDAQGRSQNYVLSFMQLLQFNYARHRSLDFYARELCITPKYLSMLTKDITGQTASEWINRVVIQEAKNLLRYSDKNIQEIAYALNFPSQSAFGKYFKRYTGKSPAAFVKNNK